MSPFALLLAVSAGFGAWFVVLGFTKRTVRPPESESSTSRSGEEQGDRSQALQAATRRAALRVEQDLTSRSAVLEDAKMVGRSLESHALAKLSGLVAGTVLAVLASVFMSVLGQAVPLPLLVAAAGLGALGGFWLPDSILKTEAEKERAYFQQASESWLELVAQLVTAGQDTFGALYTAAAYSKQPVFITIRDALRVSSASGEPPWTGLRRMADERRLRFLDPFCAALELAGTTGAGARQAILSQVEAARSKAMHDADAAAASSGEKMGAPLALISGAFMIVMGFPPLAGILESSTLSGPGI